MTARRSSVFGTLPHVLGSDDEVGVDECLASIFAMRFVGEFRVVG